MHMVGNLLQESSFTCGFTCRPPRGWLPVGSEHGAVSGSQLEKTFQAPPGERLDKLKWMQRCDQKEAEINLEGLIGLEERYYDRFSRSPGSNPSCSPLLPPCPSASDPLAQYSVTLLRSKWRMPHPSISREVPFLTSLTGHLGFAWILSLMRRSLPYKAAHSFFEQLQLLEIWVPITLTLRSCSHILQKQVKSERPIHWIDFWPLCGPTSSLPSAPTNWFLDPPTLWSLNSLPLIKISRNFNSPSHLFL